MAKKPRLDAYYRLIYRFYEALYMLCVLGKVRGPHIQKVHDFSNILAVRRRFLDNLVFLCDFEKGGLSSTALAVEERPDCNIFWISSNRGPTESVSSFLDEVLRLVKTSCGMSSGERSAAEVVLGRKCVEFASKRVKNQVKALLNGAERCQHHISTESRENGARLSSWLQNFLDLRNKDYLTICHEARRRRKDPETEMLVRRSRDPGLASQAFRKVRRSIGRLAAYVRAAEQLLEDGQQLEDLLDESLVRVVTTPTCVPRLQPDDLTTLEGVVKRLFRDDDPHRATFSSQLSHIDEQMGLQDELLRQYDPKLAQPCVHAEIQMLHCFHDHHRAFFAADPYIAISKPACLCCKLYFRHHPAGFDEPDSHEKVCHDWGTIFLPGGKADPGWIVQRDVLNLMAKDLRGEVVKEVERRRTTSEARFRHADTLTGLTASSRGVDSDSSETDEESSADVSGVSEVEHDSDSDGGAEL